MPPVPRLFVLTLRTPGGLVDSTRDINNTIIHAKTPVAVFVGPSGNRAASAGFLITIAADVAAMAPGTHIGAAHPVAGNGEKVDDTMATEDGLRRRRLTRARSRRSARAMSTLVEQAVMESRSFTEQEAAGATPPLIDLIVSDVPELIRQPRWPPGGALRRPDRDAPHRRRGDCRRAHDVAAAHPERASRIRRSPICC